MKQKTKLIAGIIILVVLIIVAAVLYKTLSSKYKNADGSGQQTETNEPATDASETQAPETDAPETDAPETEAQTETLTEAETEPVTEEIETETIEGLAPDFYAYDADGEKVYLSDFRGKPVLINFWATWCGPCQNEMPHLQKAFEEYGDTIQFMMVDLTDGYDETEKDVEKFIKKTGYTFPIFYDSDYDGTLAYGVRSIPTTIAVDKEGRIVTTYTGTMSEDVLWSIIRQLAD